MAAPRPAAPNAPLRSPTVVDGELDDDSDDMPFRAPLPLDDRLWRHPSELRGERHSGHLLPRLLAALLPRQRS